MQSNDDDPVNQLGTSKNEWWPFESLCPAEHETMGPIRCLALAGLYVLPATMSVAVISELAARGSTDEVALLKIVSGSLVLSWLTLLLFARTWNKRAKESRAKQPPKAGAAGGPGIATRAE